MTTASRLPWLTAPALAVSLCASAATNSPPETVAAKLCNAYDAVRSISCQVRKVTSDGKRPALRILSRVHFQPPNRIHVENVSPSQRRVVADGNALYYYEKGARRGFSRPVGELKPDWLASLRNVPGTPYEHLVRIRHLPEERLPGSDAFPTRVAYQAPRLYVILSLDAEGHPALIEFYASSARKEKRATYQYSQFGSVEAGCWFPRLHKGTIQLPDGSTVTETRRISSLQVNQPIARALFEAAPFFKGVEFTKNFEETYRDP